MQRVGGFVAHLFGRVVGQQAPHQVVVYPEAAKKGVAGGQFEHLRCRQRCQNIGSVFVHAQTKHCFCLVVANQVLRQHQVGEIGFANFGEQLFVGHGSFPFLGRFWRCLLTAGFA